MKNVLRLLCGWMAIALAACTGDELQQIAPLQKPVGERVISVDAYTPSDDAHTRLDFEEEDDGSLSLAWTEEDAFTAVIGNVEVTFTYDADSEQFTATLPEGVALTDGVTAYYPAYTGEYSTDLSEQTGALNSAKTFMEGTYHAASKSFTFTHSTAILKATFSGLPQDAVVSSIKIGAAPYTISIPYAEGMDLAGKGIYIYLPNVAKDENVVFSVSTTAGAVYTATQAVVLDEGIKVGTYYAAPIALTLAACNLPTGSEFNAAISNFLQGKDLTQIKFIANSVNTYKSNQIGSSNAYMVANRGILEIHTVAPQFVFNANSEDMFLNINTITAIDFGDNIDTSNVTNMYFMFKDCSSLSSLDLSSFDTSEVEEMGWMFKDCHSLPSLDLSSFDFGTVISFEGMFEYLGAYAAKKPIPVCVTQAGYDILDDKNTYINDEYATYVFPCELLQGGVINAQLKNYSSYSNKIKFVANSSTTSSNYLQAGSSTIYFVRNYQDGFIEIHTPSPKFVFNANCNDMFDGLSNIITIDFGDNIDTSNVTSMTRMFSACSSLTSLDLSKFDTSNVTSMSRMFKECRVLTSLDLSNFDTSKVRSMSNMFDLCQALTSVNVSSFNTSNVTNMLCMFIGCAELASLDLSSFDFSSVYSFTNMFSNLGISADNKPISVYVKNENDKNLLESKSTGINSNYAKIVVKQP